ncbi:MAG: hypothetical protein IKX34_02910 [Bacteroidales bacterium]|nr:hypothetical protein [Bacteroidales bacterium]
MINFLSYTLWEEVLLPICICVVLPVLIVWMVSRARQNETNRKAEIMLKAIENGVPIDTALFKSDNKKKRSLKKELLEKLNGACITSLLGAAFLALYFVGGEVANHFFMAGFYPVAGAVMVAVGIGLFISYFAGKKMLAKEIEAEEKGLTEEKQ